MKENYFRERIMRHLNFDPLVQGGYIAMFTMLTLSLLLTSASTVLLLPLALSQESVGAIQSAEQARLLASGCGHILQYRLRTNWLAQVVGQRIYVAQVGECVVLSDTLTGTGIRTVDVRAVHSDAVARWRFVLDETTKEIRAQSGSP